MWISASGLVGLPLILFLSWFRDVGPAAMTAVTTIPVLILLAVHDWIGSHLAARRSARVYQ